MAGQRRRLPLGTVRGDIFTGTLRPKVKQPKLSYVYVLDILGTRWDGVGGEVELGGFEFHQVRWLAVLGRCFIC